MPRKRKEEDEELEKDEEEPELGETPPDVDFDPWGGDEDDVAQRRRDPFRQPGTALPDNDD